MPYPNRCARSYLYVPADQQKRLTGAVLRGADAVIADLEDSVALASKEVARQYLIDWLMGGEEPSPTNRSGRVERWVRINFGQQGLDDLGEILHPQITGICLPKVGASDDVIRVSLLLDKFERKMHLASGSIVLMPLIETAAGMQSLREIAEAPRVQRLHIGELDLAADLALCVDDDETELLPLRMSVVVASAAAGLSAPLGAVSPEFRDLARLTTSTERLKRSGFYGRAAIHPAQLDTIHRVFGVSPVELLSAINEVEIYEAAVKSGVGAIVGADGRMIDEAVVRRSRHVIDVAAMTERRETP